MNCPVCSLPAIPHGQGYWLCRDGHMPTSAEQFAANYAREQAAGRWPVVTPIRCGGMPGKQGKHQTRADYMAECGYWSDK